MIAIRFLLTFIIMFIVSIGSSLANLRDLPQITVLSSTSLIKPLTEIARIYSREHNITVTVSFDEVSKQAKKIEDGLEADIFISSHPSWITSVKQKGLIDVNSITNLVKNKLALVSSANSRLNKHALQESDIEAQLTHLTIRTEIVLSNPEETTLGMYTKQVLHEISKNRSNDLLEKIENKTIKVTNATSSENAINLIKSGDTAGIIFYSDAKNNNELNIISIFDESLHEPIIYQGAVVAGKSMKNARSFLDFLKTPTARSIFRKHGLSLI